MQMILLVVVEAINQSKYVPMISLAVVGTLTNQILWVYAVLCGGLRGSTWRSTQVYVSLRRGLCGSTWVYADVYVGLHRAGEHYPIKICANDVIGCGGDINQSDFVGLHGSIRRSMWVYVEVYVGLCGGLCRSMQVYTGLCGGLHGSTWGWGTLSNQNMCQ